jgi:two-component system sensor histidine kinase AlgZ
MRSIIKQNPVPLALPDFRNLGTVLRVLLAVNALAVAAAFVREPSLADLVDTFMAMAGPVELQLLPMLALLYGLSPWLARQPYTTGACVIAALTVLTAIAAHLVVRTVVPQPPGALFRHVVLALATSGLLLYYFRLRAKALSPAITEARLQALQARIRPHFLFNSINAVLSLVRAEPRRAEVALEDMADLFRVLMRDNRDLAPLADEVELCRQYLALEKLRLTDRLDVDWHLQSMPGDALVPPLVLQPLLENAVYHGIEPSSAKGVVSVNIFLKGGEVHAIIRNPYRVDGGGHHSGNKMALGNVRERLALHFDAEASLESRVRGDTYEVHIRMPYRTDKVARPAATPAKAPAPVPRQNGERPSERRGDPARVAPALNLPRTEASRG